MTSSIILLTFLLIDSVTKGLTHIGQPCNAIIKVCLASNSWCDEKNICRCKSDYPVNVSPHSCKKGRRYGEQCRYPEECQHFDPNSYCTQLPYRSTCECYSDFSYSETSQLCEAVVTDSSKPSNLILPTAIGLSLAFASVLCCLMVAWHLCKRLNLGNMNIFSRSTLPSHSPSAPPAEAHSSFIAVDEALPNYDTALSLKETDEECDPPPSYDEVVRSEVRSEYGPKV